MILSLWQPTVMVAFIVGSLIFTGGQVLPDGAPPYARLLPYPLFPVPALVLLGPAILLFLSLTALIATSGTLDARWITGMIGPVGASAGATLFFFIAPSAGPDPLYSAALIVNLASLFVVIVGVIRHGPAYDRRRKAGELPEGHH